MQWLSLTTGKIVRTVYAEMDIYLYIGFNYANDNLM